MVKGSQRKQFVDYQDILKNTGGGYDIYMAYEGRVERIMRRPWPGPKGGMDKNPSFGIICNEKGIWVWKDHATEDKGSPVEYVMRKFGLGFEDAIEKIKWDFGMGSGENLNINPIKVTWEKGEKRKDEFSLISFDSQPFTKRHHSFWNCVEVQEADCKKLECWAVRPGSLAVNRKYFRFKKEEIVFAYYAPEIDRVKLYFPDRLKEQRFINNCPYRYLWNIRNVSSCNDGIIQKSYKDLIVTSMVTPCVIASNAEAVQIFDEEVVTEINKAIKNPWVWYGSDPDGVEKCKKITSTYNWKYINTERKYLPDFNDVYSVVKLWNEQEPGTGIKKLTEFMKSKNFPL